MGAQMKINDSLHKKLEGARMRLAMEKAVKQTMYDLMKQSMKEAPPNTDYRKDTSKPRKVTGNLVRSHSVEVRLDGNMVEGLLKNNTNYWQFVQFGTSRQLANDFVTRAFNTVAPDAKTAEYFHKFYKT